MQYQINGETSRIVHKRFLRKRNFKKYMNYTSEQSKMIVSTSLGCLIEISYDT